jgi:hypothetical protein
MSILLPAAAAGTLSPPTAVVRDISELLAGRL